MSFWKKSSDAIFVFFDFSVREYNLALKICVGNIAAIPIVIAMFYNLGEKEILASSQFALIFIMFISFTWYLLLILGKILCINFLTRLSTIFFFIILIFYAYIWGLLYGAICSISDVETDKNTANYYAGKVLCAPHSAYMHFFHKE